MKSKGQPRKRMAHVYDLCKGKYLELYKEQDETNIEVTWIMCPYIFVQVYDIKICFFIQTRVYL